MTQVFLMIKPQVHIYKTTTRWLGKKGSHSNLKMNSANCH